ncbi:MAG: hypothetical protein EP318_02010 [Rhodobacteraceae bacterium]|nr:MAG: hypothetical protein EP318_02010 [Paracoccaceae bacterium]
MFFELLATVIAGFAAGGMAFLLSRITGGRFPRRWTVGVGALAMIAFSIWNEYNWFPRSEAQLPEGVVVVAASETRSWFRPWTYVVPLVNRFAALDTGSVQRNADVPHQRIADLYLMERWRSAVGLKIAVDCQAQVQARLETVTYAETGEMESDRWEALDATDPLLTAACN